MLQAAAVLMLCELRPAAAVTIAVLAGMAFVNGRRSMAASTVGMDKAPEDRVAAMAMRAAANQLGYLLGAAAGGLALATGGFALLGAALAGLFAGAALFHLPARRPRYGQPHGETPAGPVEARGPSEEGRLRGRPHVEAGGPVLRGA
jgi:predicted MFS family arabinose efflux permease